MDYSMKMFQYQNFRDKLNELIKQLYMTKYDAKIQDKTI